MTLITSIIGATLFASTPPSFKPALKNAQSEPAKTSQSFEISLPTTLDERYLGDITVRINGDNISFPSNSFLELLRRDLTQGALEILSSKIVDERFTPESATTEDILVEYDENLQEIRVTTVLDARQRRIINFRTSPSSDKSELSTPAKVSAFVNVSGAYSHVWEDQTGGATGRSPINGNIEIGGRIGGDKGIAFISRQNYNEGSDQFIRRTETQLVYDRVDDLLRVTAGDLRYRGASFQALPQLAGVTLERFFGLEPSRVFRPVSQTSFELEQQSTVDVRINGIVIRQLLLQPGRFDLRDIPLVQGANDVELIIRDDTGREQIISNRNFFDFDLLEEGLSDFSFSAGVRAQPTATGINYSDNLAFSGFYRRGLTKSLTAGVDVQFDEQGGTGGGSLVWAAPVGVVRLEAAGSDRKNIGSGYALDLGYSITGWFNNNWRWAAGFNAETQSDRFSTLSDLNLPNIGELRPIEYALNSNVQINNQKWNISFSGQYDKGRGATLDRSSGSIGANYALNSTVSLGAFLRYADNGISDDTGAFFQLTWRPKRDHTLRASYETSEQESVLDYRYSPSTRVGSTQADIGIRRNQDRDDVNFRGALFHTGNRFDLTAQHDVFTKADFSSDRIQSSRINLSSALVFADGKFGISRPIRQAFAVVSPHKSLEDKRILVDPTESGVRARSDFLGSPIVPDLSGYNRGSIYVDVLDLDPGYDLGSGQFGVNAPLYAGYNLTVGSSASVTMLGQVVVGKNKTPLVLTGGSMQSLDNPDEEPIPVFTNRNGRLAGTGFKPGKYRLIIYSAPQYVGEMVIPEDSGNLFNFGELRIPE